MNKQQLDEIVESIIDKIEASGELPWQKPWKFGLPRNIVSKKPYSGLNLFILGFTPYQSPYWMTFLQCKELGGTIKKGQKGTHIIKMGFFEAETGEIITGKNGEEIKVTEEIPYYRLYTVFNFEQTEGIKNPDPVLEFNPIQKAESIIAGYKTMPNLKFGGGRAYFDPLNDYIQLPVKSAFHSESDYYATLFHEMTHSTGHKNRLNREEVTTSTHFGSEIYSKEELIAELGSAFLLAEAGIVDRQVDNSAAYIKSWLKALRNDKSLLLGASSKARKAVGYILGSA